MFSSQLTMSTHMIIIFFCNVQLLWKVTFRWERRFKIEVGDDVHLVMIWFLTMSISSRNAWNQRKMLPPTYGWSWWIHVEFSCVGRTSWNPLNVSSSVLLRVLSIQWSGKGIQSQHWFCCVRHVWYATGDVWRYWLDSVFLGRFSSQSGSPWQESRQRTQLWQELSIENSELQDLGAAVLQISSGDECNSCHETQSQEHRSSGAGSSEVSPSRTRKQFDGQDDSTTRSWESLTLDGTVCSKFRRERRVCRSFAREGRREKKIPYCNSSSRTRGPVETKEKITSTSGTCLLICDLESYSQVDKSPANLSSDQRMIEKYIRRLCAERPRLIYLCMIKLMTRWRQISLHRETEK